MILVFAVVSTVHEFIANNPVQYFTEHPRHLLYVMAIAIWIGLAVLAYTRLSRGAQRQVRLVAWGAAAGVLTMLWFYALYQSASLSSLIVESGSVGWLLLTLALWAGIGAFLWFEFLRAWNTKVTD